MKRVTSNDIARAVGVSQATVSYVLSGRWRELGVRQETRDTVVAAAQRLGYRVNLLAQGLKSGNTRLIGVLAPCVTFSFFSEVVRGAEDVASARDYIMVLMHTDEDSVKETKKIAVLQTYNVAGVLVIPAMSKPEPAVFTALMAGGVPVVLADKLVADLDCHAVVSADRDGAMAVVNHLLTLGHRRIAHLRGPAGVSTAEARLAGYREALRAADVPPNPAWVAGDGWTEAQGYAAAMTLLRRRHRPTAIFAASDMAAFGVYRAAAELGLRIPQDLSVAGYSDIEGAARLAVPLTTVRQPAREIGRRAAEKLLNLIETGTDTPQVVLLPVELVVRASTAAPTP